jgi:hypothetical protein
MVSVKTHTSGPNVAVSASGHTLVAALAAGLAAALADAA